jgi:hypothetical protein
VSNRGTVNAVVIAAVVGAVLWFVTSLLAGQREPWDTSAYWAIAYPLALLTCALLGYSYPERPWRWPLVLFAAQFIAMCVRNGELGNLWPLGMALFFVLSLPGIAAAKVAARFNSASRESTA